MFCSCWLDGGRDSGRCTIFDEGIRSQAVDGGSTAAGLKALTDHFEGGLRVYSFDPYW